MNALVAVLGVLTVAAVMAAFIALFAGAVVYAGFAFLFAAILGCTVIMADAAS